MPDRCVAVLGQPDKPTDAVEEYCRYLSSALAAQGTTLEIARVPWAEIGWRRALTQLSHKFPVQQGSWFLLQYTALAWSRRGFSWRFLKVIRYLKKRGARCAVVFHDAEGYFGSRVVDRVRRSLQLSTMRSAWRLADLSVFTIPPDKIPWIPAPLSKTAFIPVGANLPSPQTAWRTSNAGRESPLSVAVFSLSEGSVGAGEVNEIAAAAGFAARHIGTFRIVVIGRNSEIARSLLPGKLGTARVEVVIHSLVPADEVARLLGACDVMLFVRGPLSTRRGSAIAGIACGLPIIARPGWETAHPITEAGAVLVESGEPSGVGQALVRVLTDHPFRKQLAERSRQAYLQYFSWDIIASQFTEALRKRNPSP